MTELDNQHILQGSGPADKAWLLPVPDWVMGTAYWCNTYASELNYIGMAIYSGVGGV